MATINQIGLRKRAMFFKEEVAESIELYDWSDAASPSGITETATIDEGTSNVDKWRLRLNTGEVCGVGQTDTTTAKLGSYCMKLTSTNTNGLTHLYSPNTLTIGNTYTFSVWILNNGTSATANVKSNSGFVTVVDFIPVSSNTEWVNYQVTGVASATQMDIYIYSTRAGTIGEYVYVDNCSIK